MATYKENTAQKGSVFLYILIAIGLFGALSYSLSRGTKGQSTSNLTKAQASLIAGDILTFSQAVEQGVNRLRRNGCSESDISFQRDANADGTINNTAADHTNPTSPTDKSCHIYHADGANVTFANIENMGFSGSGFARIHNIGCDAQQASCAEMVLINKYTNLTADICLAINSQLDITGIPSETVGAGFGIFQGTFSSIADSVGDDDPNLTGHRTACYLESDENKYIFYSVLIER